MGNHWIGVRDKHKVTGYILFEYPYKWPLVKDGLDYITEIYASDCFTLSEKATVFIDGQEIDVPVTTRYAWRWADDLNKHVPALAFEIELDKAAEYSFTFSFRNATDKWTSDGVRTIEAAELVELIWKAKASE